MPLLSNLPYRRNFWILFLLLPLIGLTQPPAKSKIISERDVLSKWTKAVVNLETQANFLTSKLFVEIQLTQRKDPSAYSRAFLKNLQDSLFRVRRAGTAIYFLFKKKHYLITARHVLEDTAAYQGPEIYSWIFLRPNGSPLYDGKEIEQDTNYTHYLQLTGAMKLNQIPFIFSTTKADLAIISLDDIPYYGIQFIYTLDRKGYVPITLSDIDTLGEIKKDDHLLSLGFPNFSEVQRKHLPMTYLHAQSFAVTVPVVTKGVVEAFARDTSETFTGNIFIYYGFSGGPVIKNNKLVGINHAYTTYREKIDESQINYCLVEYSVFSKTKYIMPMLRELEKRLSQK